MADKHPYVSAPGNLVQVITHFRKSFPAVVNADTLKKLGYAPNNESYVLNVLRHLKLIDEEGKKTEQAAKAFNVHEDSAFHQQFSEFVKVAYSDLFDLHGDSAWTLDTTALISFFRTNDQTTAIVGQRQANTYTLLAAYSGHGDVPEPKGASKKANKQPSNKPAPAPAGQDGQHKQKLEMGNSVPQLNTVGLTVRIEINLPASGDQETFDRIFRSIRENLINGDIS